MISHTATPQTSRRSLEDFRRITLASSFLLILFGVGFGQKGPHHRIYGLATYPTYYCRNSLGMLVTGDQAANGACCNYTSFIPQDSDEKASPIPYNGTINPSPSAASCISGSDLTSNLIEQAAQTRDFFNKNLKTVQELPGSGSTAPSSNSSGTPTSGSTETKTVTPPPLSSTITGSNGQSSSAASASESTPFANLDPNQATNASLTDLSSQNRSAAGSGDSPLAIGGGGSGGTSAQTAPPPSDSRFLASKSAATDESASIASSGGGGGWGGGGGDDYRGSVGGGGSGSASFGNEGNPNVNPLGSADPEDYFTRIGIDENIFKIIERVYRRKAADFIEILNKAPVTSPSSKK